VAGKTTFENLPIELDWSRAIIGGKFIEVPLINSLNGFISKFSNHETRLLISKTTAEDYHYISLESNFKIKEESFGDLIKSKKENSYVRFMKFDKNLKSMGFDFYRIESNPNANMPLDCETVTFGYYEGSCYYNSSSSVVCNTPTLIYTWTEEICSGSGGGGGSSSNYRIFEIDKSGLSACHQELIEDIMGGTQTQIKKIFSLFNDEVNTSVPYNLRFQYGNCGPATACTNPQLTNNYAVVNFNQSAITNATDLSMARSTMHEVLHAYLVYELEYPSDCDLNCLLNDYIAIYGGADLNPVHHNLYVETKFLNDIAFELKNYASSVGYNVSLIGDQYFKDMAWGGLHETDVFKNTLTVSEQQRINNRYNAELTNTNVGNIAPIGTLLCD
jgi:hypothetical protein